MKSILLSKGRNFIGIINNFYFHCFRFRCLIHWIVTKKVFDMFIMFVIVLSSIALASEDPVNENSDRNILLGKADYAFTAIFTFECCLKVSYWKNLFYWKYCSLKRIMNRYWYQYFRLPLWLIRVTFVKQFSVREIRLFWITLFFD